jgi:hypothetical protein
MRKYIVFQHDTIMLRRAHVARLEAMQWVKLFAGWNYRLAKPAG